MMGGGAKLVLGGGVAVAVGVLVVSGQILTAYKTPEVPGPYNIEGSGKTIWLGDSTSVGVGSYEKGGSLPLQVAREEGQEGVRVLGESGATIKDVAGQAMQAKEAEKVFIIVGGNDVKNLVSKEQFERDYRQVLQSLEGKDVVVFGVPDMGSVKAVGRPTRYLLGWRGRQFDGVVKRVAREQGVNYVELQEHTGGLFRQESAKYFSQDYFHPNQEGYRLWAEAYFDAKRVW